MPRLLVLILAAFSLLLAAGDAAEAFEPRNQRHHPYAPVTMPMTTKVAATATLTWAVVDQYGWTGVEDVVHRALDTDSPDPQSLGNVYNDFLAADGLGQITIRQAREDETPDLRHNIVSSAFTSAMCGGNWPTACVYITNPLPVPAYYNAASMILWAYESQAHVYRHESNHVLARACDQYRGGCPLASNGQWESTVACTGNQDTLMDCSNAARTATAFDYETFKTAYPVGTSFLQAQQQCTGFPCYVAPRWQFGNTEGATAYRPDAPTVVLSDGFSRRVAWERLIDGEWVPEWGQCTAHGDREDLLLTQRLASAVFLPAGSNIYVHSEGWRSIAPAC